MIDTDALYSAIRDLQNKSVSSNADGSSYCTVRELKKFKDEVVIALTAFAETIQNSQEY